MASNLTGKARKVSTSKAKPKTILTKEQRGNWNRLHYLLFHPAQLRKRVFTLTSPAAPAVKFEALLVHCVAIGGSSAVYLATKDVRRSKLGLTSEGRLTEVFEGGGKAPGDLEGIIKFFDDPNAYDRELYMVSGLQRFWRQKRAARVDTDVPGPFDEDTFGPIILGYSDELNCIMYERLEVAEQSCFYNDQFQQLRLDHFPSLFSQVRFMHSVGIVHQDIRGPNIGFRNGRPVLIDFGFARMLETSPLATPDMKGSYRSTGYCGTRETASDRVLDILANNPAATVVVTPKDDLISLFKLHFVTTCGPAFYTGCRTWPELKEAWEQIHSVGRLERMEVPDILLELAKIFHASKQGVLPRFLERNKKSERVRDLQQLYTNAKSVKLGARDGSEDALIPPELG